MKCAPPQRRDGGVALSDLGGRGRALWCKEWRWLWCWVVEGRELEVGEAGRIAPMSRSGGWMQVGSCSFDDTMTRSGLGIRITSQEHVHGEICKD